MGLQGLLQGQLYLYLLLLNCVAILRSVQKVIIFWKTIQRKLIKGNIPLGPYEINITENTGILLSNFSICYSAVKNKKQNYAAKSLQLRYGDIWRDDSRHIRFQEIYTITIHISSWNATPSPTICTLSNKFILHFGTIKPSSTITLFILMRHIFL
jgi:hypothetical protein